MLRCCDQECLEVRSQENCCVSRLLFAYLSNPLLGPMCCVHSCPDLKMGALRVFEAGSMLKLRFLGKLAAHLVHCCILVCEVAPVVLVVLVVLLVRDFSDWVESVRNCYHRHNSSFLRKEVFVCLDRNRTPICGHEIPNEWP